MNDTNLKSCPLSGNILLIIYDHEGWKRPAFVLKDSFQAEQFAPPAAEPKRMSAVELTLDTGVWRAFQERCRKLGITPSDCFNAWVRFVAQPEAHQAVKELMGKENEYGNIFGLRR